MAANPVIAAGYRPQSRHASTETHFFDMAPTEAGTFATRPSHSLRGSQSRGTRDPDDDGTASQDSLSLVVLNESMYEDFDRVTSEPLARW